MEKKLDTKLVESFVETSREIAQIESKISNAIAVFQKQLEEKRTQEQSLKEAIKVVMIRDGIKKFENDIISLTYIAPTTRTSIDTALLKEEMPELWDKYSKTTEVSDSVRIKVK